MILVDADHLEIAWPATSQTGLLTP
jgi:hypothetical protein